MKMRSLAIFGIVLCSLVILAINTSQSLTVGDIVIDFDDKDLPLKLSFLGVLIGAISIHLSKTSPRKYFNQIALMSYGSTFSGLSAVWLSIL